MMVYKHAQVHICVCVCVCALSAHASYFSGITQESISQRALFLSFTWIWSFQGENDSLWIGFKTRWAAQTERD